MTLAEPELLEVATEGELEELFAQAELLDELEADWRVWLAELFPAYCTADFAPFHEQLWTWVWSIRRGARPTPLVEIIFRGGAKSTSAELACVALAARRSRRYGLYICETQDQADDHVSNVAALLESSKVEEWYPSLADRMVGKYGNSKGWRVNRLRTSNGFTVDAVGLDTAARGVKLEEQRPDFLILDDLDAEHDTEKATAKKIKTLTRALLPAGSNDLAVLAVQNLVHEDSIFARLADSRADFLADRTVVGPIPAVEDATWGQDGIRTVLTGGTATWDGMPLGRCQEVIDDIGIVAWRAEAQHETEPPAGGIFSHLDFSAIRVREADLPTFETITVWCDPAVTKSDESDACGVQCDGLGDDGVIYRLFSWEQRATPVEALSMALEVAFDWGADSVGVETDQGGDTWTSVYREAVEAFLAAHPGPHVEVPKFESAKAGSTQMSKTERAQKMAARYGRGWFRHLDGGAHALEQALFRFPLTKPFDLTDAAVWSANHLRPEMLSEGRRRPGFPVPAGAAA